MVSRFAWGLAVLAMGCGGGAETATASETGGARGSLIAASSGGAPVAEDGGMAPGGAQATGGASVGRGGASTGGVRAGGSGGQPGAGGVIAEPLCVPGKSEPCTGPGACAGGQACKGDGSGYEACLCAAGSGEADAGSGAIVPFRGPDGQQWVCSAASDGSCRCAHDTEDFRTGFCERAGHSCRLARCEVPQPSCCGRDPGTCVCGPSSGSACDQPDVTSCP